MFEQHYNKRRKENPGESKYITLCHIFECSGADKEEVSLMFHDYLTETIDYDAPEEDVMVNYLYDVAQRD